MIHRMPLLADLTKLRTELESDLHAQAATPDVNRTLQLEYCAAVDTQRTGDSYSVWLADEVARVAVSWLLDSVFLRFCEDNDLVPAPYLSGPNQREALAEDRQAAFAREQPGATDRDWLIHGFDNLCAESPLMASILNTRGGELPSLAISNTAATNLVEFWRTRDEHGDLIHDFTDPVSADGTGRWETRFLGDLYQDLSEDQRKTYSLLQTPNFVAEFILDHTLEPAIAAIGLLGLRTIDPVCGSGQFMLSIFRRLLGHWRALDPGLPPWTKVERALDSMHGVDRNSNAVSITRFRLLVAAIQAGGGRRLADVPDLRIAVATGDSLHEPMVADCARPDGKPVRQTSVEFFSNVGLLQAGSYNVVVGNPPYILPRNRLDDVSYRERYSVCTGKYSLTVPFIVRFFDLACGGPHEPGFVGLLSSNSYMKRDFGRALVEQFFPMVDITGIVDTSGAYIPSHGSPTVLLLGRNRPPARTPVPAVLCLRSESDTLADPSEGQVWRSIVSAVRRDAGYTDSWTQRVDLDQSVLRTFPCSLTDPVSAEILHRMDGSDTSVEKRVQLADRVLRIGFFANTGSDEVFIASAAKFRRARAEREALIPVLRGSDIRDWTATPTDYAAMFSSTASKPGTDTLPNLMRNLWPYRIILQHNGTPWYRWHHISELKDAHPWRIAFSWVSTHNHFVVLRDRVAPLNSAPILRMPNATSNSEILQLAALLNSSLACFWLKHHSNSKGQPGMDQTGIGEPWSVFYEFTGNRLGEFPLPRGRWFQDRWTVHAEAIDELARELADTNPQSILRRDTLPTDTELDAARARWTKAHGRLVGLQEELDWEIYGRYGLTTNTNELLAPADAVPELNPGERAFEIVLARRIARGELNSSWFQRNGAAVITSIPREWPDAYRETVERRIELIESRHDVYRVEQPEFKRRWHSPGWDSLIQDALESWILDRMEEPRLWFDHDEGGRTAQPRLQTFTELVESLSDDVDLLRAVALYDPDAYVQDVLRNLIEGEHVPFLAALRHRPSGCKKYEAWKQVWDRQRAEDANGDPEQDSVESRRLPPKYAAADFLKQSYWRARGKLDVPNERFVSYPVHGPNADLFGWAGWDHCQRALALAAHIRSLMNDSTAESRLVPLLAGLLELEPWIAQWHPDQFQEIVHFRTSVQLQHRLTEDDLAAWRPPPPKRGRPRKIPKP